MAIARYRNELVSDDPIETWFQAMTPGDVVIASGCAGAHITAGRLIDRYPKVEPVHRALMETFPPAQHSA